MNRRVKNAVFGIIGGAAGTFIIGQATAALKNLPTSWPNASSTRIRRRQ